MAGAVQLTLHAVQAEAAAIALYRCAVCINDAWSRRARGERKVASPSRLVHEFLKESCAQEAAGALACSSLFALVYPPSNCSR